MLQDKDIKNLSELKTTFVYNHKKESFFSDMIKILKIGKHHALFSKVKEKGIPVLAIIQVLITFPFIEQKNVHQFIGCYWNKFAGFGKDVYYRLKNNHRINWRKFLFAVVKRAVITLQEREQIKNKEIGIKAFIFDDSSIAKTGILTEGVSRIWNHVIQKSILGYQLLVHGLYDGTMFIPINFSFHREKGKNKKKYSYKIIRKLNRKNIKRNRKYNLYYIRVVVQWNGQTVVLYFTRKGKNGNWKTIMNTDLSSNFNKTIEIYQLRWSIEVFFKEAKQLLDLGKSESQDFDAQVADATITMTQYIFLSIRNRIEKYESIGKIYKNTKAETLEMQLHERLILLLIAILEIIEELFENADVDKLFVRMINDETVFDRIKLLLHPIQNNFKQAA